MVTTLIMASIALWIELLSYTIHLKLTEHCMSTILQFKKHQFLSSCILRISLKDQIGREKQIV